MLLLMDTNSTHLVQDMRQLACASASVPAVLPDQLSNHSNLCGIYGAQHRLYQLAAPVRASQHVSVPCKAKLAKGQKGAQCCKPCQAFAAFVVRVLNVVLPHAGSSS
jgi:hypothetical protein